jgi:hypothetical protein
MAFIAAAILDLGFLKDALEQRNEDNVRREVGIKKFWASGSLLGAATCRSLDFGVPERRLFRYRGSSQRTIQNMYSHYDVSTLSRLEIVPVIARLS